MKKALLIISVLIAPALFAQSSIEQPKLNEPSGLVTDSNDNLFVLMKYGIAKITPDGKVIDLRKLDGNGSIDRAYKNLVIDSKNTLYASDGNIISKIIVSNDNKVNATTFTGASGGYRIVDGPIANAIFVDIKKMTIDKNDNIYLTDSYDKIKTEIGSNYVTDNYFKKDLKKNYTQSFSLIRKISSNGIVTTLKTPNGKYVVPNGVCSLTADAEGNLIYTNGGFGRSVEKINTTTGIFNHIAGQPYKREFCPVYTTGDTSKAELFSPETIIINKKGEIIYADERSHRISKIANGKVSTVAGNSIIDPCSQNIGGRAQEGCKDGKALTALFYFPKGMAYDSKGNLYVADHGNNCIRKISPDGMVSSFTKPNPSD